MSIYTSIVPLSVVYVFFAQYEQESNGDNTHASHISNRDTNNRDDTNNWYSETRGNKEAMPFLGFQEILLAGDPHTMLPS